MRRRDMEQKTYRVFRPNKGRAEVARGVSVGAAALVVAVAMAGAFVAMPWANSFTVPAERPLNAQERAALSQEYASKLSALKSAEAADAAGAALSSETRARAAEARAEGLDASMGPEDVSARIDGRTVEGAEPAIPAAWSFAICVLAPSALALGAVAPIEGHPLPAHLAKYARSRSRAGRYVYREDWSRR